MLESVCGFDWDEGNSAKCWNRVSKEEIEYLFQQPGVLIAPDIKHSQDEDRYLAIGISSQQRYIFVAFTLRNQEDEILIRPISARYMRDTEVQKYGQNFPKT
ncbi:MULTISPECIES: BrnT family toxin [unclassified Anabaena]|uniref:BrnT family toxin n=1 Tax=unclassified Anabaena TaxID=2619674 RepID=UPI0039C612DF